MTAYIQVSVNENGGTPFFLALVLSNGQRMTAEFSPSPAPSTASDLLGAVKQYAVTMAGQIGQTITTDQVIVIGAPA